MDTLARTAHRDDVEVLAAAGILEERGRKAAHHWIRGRLDWAGWTDRLLLALGTALVLAGIVYFAAFNWRLIPPFVKFATLQAALVVGVAATWRVGLARPAGKMLLSGCAVVVGVLLAVFGQVYQTGADPWELFAGWAALITGWVAIGRFAPLWVLWIALIDLALWQHGTLTRSWVSLEWTVLVIGLVNGVALAAWEAGAARGVEWLQVRWPRRLLWLATLAPLTVLALALIFIGSFGQTLGGIAWLVAMVAGVALYRYGPVIDLTALSLGAASAGVVAFSLVARVLFESRIREPFLQLSFVAIVIAGALGAWLKSVWDSKEAVLE